MSPGALTQIAEAVDRALDEEAVTDVLSVLLGATVGLVIALAEKNGADPDKQITIDGGKSRDVTIGAKKGGAS